ncbi:hypothetical protein OPV22_006557 [Ensete ventricosum]|uniref:Uncharacterized protein n=1 Tax=Ensete ventricosum TaxID=4639 RepID=A0AAV8RL39_ENSVE|nr:hypothetical protein OPV22_006557 [Ensete ventricosum]
MDRVGLDSDLIQIPNPNIIQPRTTLANLTSAATALLGTTASAALTPLTSVLGHEHDLKLPGALLPPHNDAETIGGSFSYFSVTFLRTFLDLHQFGNKEAIAKERDRLSDEINRGYFADISEIRKNDGKIAMANNTIIPSSTAVKFPDLEVSLSDGRCVKVPINAGQTVTDTSQMPASCVSLLCLSFRASSLGMVESWILPFRDAFSDAGTVQIYEVSFIDSWLFSLGPARRLILKMMRKSNDPRRQILYSFGDHYYFRKKLQILNLLTGYIFLLDGLGRIRWQEMRYFTKRGGENKEQ